MNVHLLKDKKFSKEIYNEIFQNLNAFNKPLKFIRCTYDICLDNINSEPDQIEEAEFKQKEHDYYNISRSRIMSSLFSRNKFKFPVTHCCRFGEVRTAFGSPNSTFATGITPRSLL